MNDDARRNGAELNGMFPRVYDEEYLVMERGKGPYVWDETGNRYIDVTAGSHNANIGHGRESIANAAADQLSTLEFVRTEYVNDTTMKFTERVTELAPRDFEHVWVVSGGSLATESALKMAYQYHLLKGNPGKHKVISRKNSYHGSTLGAMTVTGYEPYTQLFDEMTRTYPNVAEGAPYRCEFCSGDGGRECGVQCADELEEAIRRESPETVGAFIMEPVTGSTNPGARPHDGYVERVRDICDEYDLLLIFDEIMTSFGRSGAYFEAAELDVRPDIILSGKGMTAGYAPMGGVFPHRSVVEQFEDFDYGFVHGHTNTFSPSTAAVGSAVVEYLTTNDVVESAARKGVEFEDALRDLYDHDIVGDVRGKGMMWGIEFVEDRESKAPLAQTGHEFAEIWREECEKRGLLTCWTGAHIDGERGDATLVTPPLTIDEPVMDELTDRLYDAVGAVQGRVIT